MGRPPARFLPSFPCLTPATWASPLFPNTSCCSFTGETSPLIPANVTQLSSQRYFLTAPQTAPPPPRLHHCSHRPTSFSFYISSAPDSTYHTDHVSLPQNITLSRQGLTLLSTKLFMPETAPSAWKTFYKYLFNE